MYSIEEKTLQTGPHQKKVYVITFHDPKQAILGEFLMTDAPLLNYQILGKIEQVLTGECAEVTSSGQRTSLVMKKNTTRIEDMFVDLYPDLTTYPAYTIETVQLKELIQMWREKTTE